MSAARSSTEDRAPIAARVRFNVLRRADFCCQLCGSRPGNDKMHVDHVLPWSLGGSDHEDNLIALCARCNTGKGALIAIPPSLCAGPRDADGFTTWKRFGAWTLEACDTGMLINLPSHSGYVWIAIERVHEQDWIRHFSMKTWWREELHRGLCDALDFARRIFVAPERPPLAPPADSQRDRHGQAQDGHPEGAET